MSQTQLLLFILVKVSSYCSQDLHHFHMSEKPLCEMKERNTAAKELEITANVEHELESPEIPCCRLQEMPQI